MIYRHPSTWFLQVELRPGATLPAGQQLLKYKYCIMNDNEENGGIPRWEPGEEHKAELTRNKIECKDVWGVCILLVYSEILTVGIAWKESAMRSFTKYTRQAVCLSSTFFWI